MPGDDEMVKGSWVLSIEERLDKLEENTTNGIASVGKSVDQLAACFRDLKERVDKLESHCHSYEQVEGEGIDMTSYTDQTSPPVYYPEDSPPSAPTPGSRSVSTPPMNRVQRDGKGDSTEASGEFTVSRTGDSPPEPDIICNCGTCIFRDLESHYCTNPDSIYHDRGRMAPSCNKSIDKCYHPRSPRDEPVKQKFGWRNIWKEHAELKNENASLREQLDARLRDNTELVHKLQKLQNTTDDYNLKNKLASLREQLDIEQTQHAQSLVDGQTLYEKHVVLKEQLAAKEKILKEISDWNPNDSFSENAFTKTHWKAVIKQYKDELAAKEKELQQFKDRVTPTGKSLQDPTVFEKSLLEEIAAKDEEIARLKDNKASSLKYFNRLVNRLRNHHELIFGYLVESLEFGRNEIARLKERIRDEIVCERCGIFPCDSPVSGSATGCKDFQTFGETMEQKDVKLSSANEEIARLKDENAAQHEQLMYKDKEFATCFNINEIYEKKALVEKLSSARELIKEIGENFSWTTWNELKKLLKEGKNDEST